MTKKAQSAERGFRLFRTSTRSSDPCDGIEWVPPRESDALFEALRRAYPGRKTHRERMCEALVEFLASELNQRAEEEPVKAAIGVQAVSAVAKPEIRFVNGAARPDRSYQQSKKPLFRAHVTPQSHTADRDKQVPRANPIANGPPPFTEPSRKSKDWEDMTVVWKSQSGLTKGARPRRMMTEDERSNYRMRRVRGACVSCKRKKRKCTHDPQPSPSASLDSIVTPPPEMDLRALAAQGKVRPSVRFADEMTASQRVGRRDSHSAFISTESRPSLSDGSPNVAPNATQPMPSLGHIQPSLRGQHITQTTKIHDAVPVAQPDGFPTATASDSDAWNLPGANIYNFSMPHAFDRFPPPAIQLNHHTDGDPFAWVHESFHAPLKPSHLLNRILRLDTHTHLPTTLQTATPTSSSETASADNIQFINPSHLTKQPLHTSTQPHPWHHSFPPLYGPQPPSHPFAQVEHWLQQKTLDEQHPTPRESVLLIPDSASSSSPSSDAEVEAEVDVESIPTAKRARAPRRKNRVKFDFSTLIDGPPTLGMGMGTQEVAVGSTLTADEQTRYAEHAFSGAQQQQQQRRRSASRHSTGSRMSGVSDVLSLSSALTTLSMRDAGGSRRGSVYSMGSERYVRYDGEDDEGEEDGDGEGEDDGGAVALRRDEDSGSEGGSGSEEWNAAWDEAIAAYGGDLKEFEWLADIPLPAVGSATAVASPNQGARCT